MATNSLLPLNVAVSLCDDLSIPLRVLPIPPAAYISVYVKSYDGITYMVRVLPTSSVGELKHFLHLCYAKGIPAEHQELLFGGRSLPLDQEDLNSVGIRNNSSITQLGKIVGGANGGQSSSDDSSDDDNDHDHDLYGEDNHEGGGSASNTLGGLQTLALLDTTINDLEPELAALAEVDPELDFSSTMPIDSGMASQGDSVATPPEVARPPLPGPAIAPNSLLVLLQSYAGLPALETTITNKKARPQQFEAQAPGKTQKLLSFLQFVVNGVLHVTPGETSHPSDSLLPAFQNSTNADGQPSNANCLLLLLHSVVKTVVAGEEEEPVNFGRTEQRRKETNELAVVHMLWKLVPPDAGFPHDKTSEPDMLQYWLNHMASLAQKVCHFGILRYAWRYYRNEGGTVAPTKTRVFYCGSLQELRDDDPEFGVGLCVQLNGVKVVLEITQDALVLVPVATALRPNRPVKDEWFPNHELTAVFVYESPGDDRENCVSIFSEPDGRTPEARLQLPGPPHSVWQAGRLLQTLPAGIRTEDVIDTAARLAGMANYVVRAVVLRGKPEVPEDHLFTGAPRSVAMDTTGEAATNSKKRKTGGGSKHYDCYGHMSKKQFRQLSGLPSVGRTTKRAKTVSTGGKEQVGATIIPVVQATATTGINCKIMRLQTLAAKTKPSNTETGHNAASTSDLKVATVGRNGEIGPSNSLGRVAWSPGVYDAFGQDCKCNLIDRHCSCAHEFPKRVMTEVSNQEVSPTLKAWCVDENQEGAKFLIRIEPSAGPAYVLLVQVPLKLYTTISYCVADNLTMIQGGASEAATRRTMQMYKKNALRYFPTSAVGGGEPPSMNRYALAVRLQTTGSNALPITICVPTIDADGGRIPEETAVVSFTCQHRFTSCMVLEGLSLLIPDKVDQSTVIVQGRQMLVYTTTDDVSLGKLQCDSAPNGFVFTGNAVNINATIYSVTEGSDGFQFYQMMLLSKDPDAHSFNWSVASNQDEILRALGSASVAFAVLKIDRHGAVHRLDRSPTSCVRAEVLMGAGPRPPLPPTSNTVELSRGFQLSLTASGANGGSAAAPTVHYSNSSERAPIPTVPRTKQLLEQLCVRTEGLPRLSESKWESTAGTRMGLMADAMYIKLDSPGCLNNIFRPMRSVSMVQAGDKERPGRVTILARGLDEFEADVKRIAMRTPRAATFNPTVGPMCGDLVVARFHVVKDPIKTQSLGDCTIKAISGSEDGPLYDVVDVEGCEHLITAEEIRCAPGAQVGTVVGNAGIGDFKGDTLDASLVDMFKGGGKWLAVQTQDGRLGVGPYSTTTVTGVAEKPAFELQVDSTNVLALPKEVLVAWLKMTCPDLVEPLEELAKSDVLHLPVDEEQRKTLLDKYSDAVDSTVQKEDEKALKQQEAHVARLLELIELTKQRIHTEAATTSELQNSTEDILEVLMNAAKDVEDRLNAVHNPRIGRQNCLRQPIRTEEWTKAAAEASKCKNRRYRDAGGHARFILSSKKLCGHCRHYRERYPQAPLAVAKLREAVETAKGSPTTENIEEVVKAVSICIELAAMLFTNEQAETFIAHQTARLDQLVSAASACSEQAASVEKLKKSLEAMSAAYAEEEEGGGAAQ